MNRLILIIFWVLAVSVQAATYWEVSGGSGVWSGTNNWSNSDGGPAGAGPPTSSDFALFDSHSGNLSVDGTLTACAVAAFSASGSGGTGDYAGTLTFTAGKTLTVYGNVAFSAGMTIARTGTLVIAGVSTITTAGQTLTGTLVFDYNGIVTLTGNLTVTGLVTVQISTLTLNSGTLYANGGLTVTGAMNGTSLIQLGGTGQTWQGGGLFANAITINCTSLTITGTLNPLGGSGNIITYTTGTVTASAATIRGNASAWVYMNTNGITWGTIASYFNLQIWASSNFQCTNMNITGGDKIELYTTNGSTFTTANLTGGTAANNNFYLGTSSVVTLNITNSISWVGSANTWAGSSGNAGIVNYSGTYANCNISNSTGLSYLNFSGSSIPMVCWQCTLGSGVTGIFNANGSTLMNQKGPPQQ